jgi:hypothetical protein
MEKYKSGRNRHMDINEQILNAINILVKAALQ